MVQFRPSAEWEPCGSRVVQNEAVEKKGVERERQEARRGAGGLDPVEVLASLPEKLQRCFQEGA